MIRTLAHPVLAALLLMLPHPSRAAEPRYVLGGETPTILDKLIGPYGRKDEGATIEALLTGNSGVTAEKIADWAFCDCVDPVSRDAIRGVAVAPKGTTIDLVNAVAGYVLNENPNLSHGPFPVVVGSLGVAVAGADHTQSWGANFVFADGKGRKKSNGRDRFGYAIEADVAITSPDTTATGLLFGGKAIVQPKNATALTIATLDDRGGQIARWTYGLYALDGATDNFAHIGAVSTRPGSPSQVIEMGFYGPRGDGNILKLQAISSGGAPILNLTSPSGAPAMNVGGGYRVEGIAGVSCDGPPTPRYRVRGGIVTAC